MDSSIVSGLIGGAISVAIVTYLSAKLRDQASDGSLRWGWGLFLLGLLCLVIVVFAVSAFFHDSDVWTDRGEFFAVIGLIVGFGFGAILCFADYFIVRGSYDDQGIEFRTPWTGTKVERWKDLESVRFSAQMGWYVLKFRSGKVIRLSTLLSGHGGVIEKLDQMGFDLE